jgi:hypothetical protein
MADANPAAGDSTTAAPGLAFGLAFADLYERDGLLRVDAAWHTFLAEADNALAARFQAALAAPDALDAKAEAALLIEAGPAVDAFVARLFGIEPEFAELRAAHAALDPLWRVKWKFVKRQALLSVTPEQVAALDADAARATLAAAAAPHGEPDRAASVCCSTSTMCR